MPPCSDVAARPAQAKKKATRADEIRRANERARKDPHVSALEQLVRDLYNPQPGVATKKPRDGAWSFQKHRKFGAYDLRRHVEQKESLAVTWGKHSNIRVIDVDAHDGSGPRTVLPLLWEQVQALHFGRGKVLPDFKGKDIPTHNPDNSPVEIDGIIKTTERGMHYMERLESSDEDTAYADKMRVEACLERFHVADIDGKVEVMPNGNGGSRLPLGYGCEFIWPPVGKVDLATGIEILSNMKPVPRDFVDFPFEVPRRDQDVPLEEFIECATRDALICEYDPDEPTYPVPNFVVSKCMPMRVPQTNEAGDVHKRSDVGEAFMQEVEKVRENGAARGQRNREVWDQCFALRLPKGLSRDAAVAAMTAWIDNAPHTSADLSDKSKRNENLRHVNRLMNRIDAKLASGEFYIGGSGRSSGSWDPLLMYPNDKTSLPVFEALGKSELLRHDGASMLDGLPLWIQSALPALVGAIKWYTVGGKIMMPVNALKEYARTKKPKKSPWTGNEKPAYQVLLDALVHFGIIGGLISAGNVAKHKASLYESNVEVEDNGRQTGCTSVDSTGPVPQIEGGDEPGAGQGSGAGAQDRHAAKGTTRKVVDCANESDSWNACANVQVSERTAAIASAGEFFPELLRSRSVRKVPACDPSGGRRQGAAADDHDAGRYRRDGDSRLVS